MNNLYAYSLNNDSEQQKRFSNLQSIELKNQVLSSHETYLQLDDNDQRDEYRKKLHKYVVNYLLRIPHQNKFLLPEMNFIFENCIENNQKFDPIKAAESFDILFTMTNNLCLKPWRNEFRQICIYNCNFTHLISQQVPHYDHILKLMGYALKSKNGIPNYYLTKRVNTEILKLISFDCFVGYVEFRYIYQFGEILKGKSIKPDWNKIYRLRKKFTGDFESTLENYLLIYQDQIEFDLKKDLKINGLKKSEFKYDLNSEQQQQLINKKYKHLSNLINQYEQHQQDNLYEKPTNCNLIDLDSLPAKNTDLDDLEQLLLNSSFGNERQEFNSPLKSNYQPVSTYNHQSIDSSIGNGLTRYLKSNDNYYLTKHNLLTNHQISEETNLDQVDFIDEEEDIGINLKNELNSKIRCLDNNAQQLELAVSNNDKLNNSLTNGKIKSNSLEKKSKSSKKPLIEKKYSSLDCRGNNIKKKSSLSASTIKRVLSSSMKDDLKWTCKHCTYLNDSKDEICTICGKSMKSNKNDDLSMMILGKECDICTLVNKKNVNQCSACGNNLNLKNSATYI